MEINFFFLGKMLFPRYHPPLVGGGGGSNKPQKLSCGLDRIGETQNITAIFFFLVEPANTCSDHRTLRNLASVRAVLLLLLNATSCSEKTTV